MKFAVTICLLVAVVQGVGAQQVTVGSKAFTESYVLGEIAEALLVEAGFNANHRQGMGGTKILWEALLRGDIDVYSEYTGTIFEAILPDQDPAIGLESLREILAEKGIGISGRLGFNNTYAIAMKEDKAERLGIETISDLLNHQDLRVGISSEFRDRPGDGWFAMAGAYGLDMPNLRAMNHTAAYLAIDTAQSDIVDVYSTDAKIADLDLRVLEDDLGFFPEYEAVYLYRLELPKEALAALESVAGTLDDERMTRLNSVAERTGNYSSAASEYFENRSLAADVQTESVTAYILRLTLQHLKLVGISMALAIALALPLGIIAARPGALSGVILSVVAILQTIPSLALLALLVPLSGIGMWTAIFALFLYSLLPIVRNTATGLQDIAPGVRESAAALGLSSGARLRLVFLPIASRTILAGIKTSAVINVGTATLAALVGAGGLGEPIISGLNLLNNEIILQGAIPAAILAVLVQLGFDALDRFVIPKGLRL